MPSIRHGETGMDPAYPSKSPPKAFPFKLSQVLHDKRTGSPEFPFLPPQRRLQNWECSLPITPGTVSAVPPVAPSTMAMPPAPRHFQEPAGTSGAAVWCVTLLPQRRGKGQPLVPRWAGKAASSTPTKGSVALPSVVGCRGTHNKSFHLSLWLNAPALACWKYHLLRYYGLAKVHAR